MRFKSNLEPIGLTFILVAVAWEVFLEGILSSTAVSAEFFGIKEQLFIIWDALEADSIGEFRAENYDRFFRAYKSPDGLIDQLGIARLIRFVLFAVGSALVIFSKVKVE